MKRASFVLVILTVGITLPPLYTQWMESQRLQEIKRLKQKARPVFGERLAVILSELKNGTPPSAIILYPGNTKSHLEPCGCYQEQGGGLPRRASVVEQIRQHGFGTALVDAGNIFYGREAIDAKRCKVNLKAMSAMRYDAMALSEADLSYNDAYLRQQHTIAGFPFLATTENDFTQPFVIQQVGKHAIGFVVGKVSEQVHSESDVIVALGNPTSLKHIDVVIAPTDVETVVSDEKIVYLGCEPEGKTLGFLALWINPNGGLDNHYATQLALTGDVEESKSVRQLLADFYQEVGQASHITPLFASQHLEQDAKNGYVSATACQKCHEQEYLQWSTTRHAFAFETLLKKERYFDAGCLSCHTTGFGYPTGYQAGDQDTTLKGVQCETCHGPSRQHIGNPKKTNIRRGADTDLCLECHDTKHSPGFAEVAALHTKDVNHSRDVMNLEELLESRIRRVGKPTLELFVMSYCPFGVQAEEKILPIVKTFGEKIDFKLQFIAQEKAAPSPEDITPFASLHGYPEVAESIRQLLIAEAYPDRYLDYVLCRGKKLDESWETCAEKLGINVARIQGLFDAPEAEQLFRENIKRAQELGINASPTVLVDNHEFRVSQLLRASGAACQ